MKISILFLIVVFASLALEAEEHGGQAKHGATKELRKTEGDFLA